ncbi:hypothetical protein [Lactobacillus sp. UCMA15818]|uniref:hypothetical protein n=1 Tax=Lactobacillus sp. UCMA15818 TaxID=2583394 RepID=UPI0025B236A9|nr:hypothetical protein [Lactobacillus sp. UCMA15818]MDN2452553.1 hypothetical protein [Lactobacillus sp. UCMA15818]
MNNEQAQQELENIGSKLKLNLEEELPSFSFENGVIGFVARQSISILAGGGYLKYKLKDKEYAILTQLSATEPENRVASNTFDDFVNVFNKSEESTQKKIINFIKNLTAKDTRRES